VREVAGKLASRVVQIEASRTAGRPAESLAAYDLLLRARALIAPATRAGNVEARRMLDRALMLDPQYAELYVVYAQLLYERSQRGWTEQIVEGFEESERLANKALALDPTSAGAFAQLARVHAVFGRYE
jgi:tetratricopeptide (TPR) repeat protein